MVTALKTSPKNCFCILPPEFGGEFDVYCHALCKISKHQCMLCTNKISWDLFFKRSLGLISVMTTAPSILHVFVLSCPPLYSISSWLSPTTQAQHRVAGPLMGQELGSQNLKRVHHLLLLNWHRQLLHKLLSALSLWQNLVEISSIKSEQDKFWVIRSSWPIYETSPHYDSSTRL